MEQTVKNVKLLRLLGLIFGLVGAGIMLFSLLMDASVVNSVFGSISVPMTRYLEGIIWLVFVIAAFAIAFTLLRWDIPLIVTGAIAIAFSVFMIAHIGSVGQDGGKYATVSFGAGLIMFFLAAALMLAAGILYIVARSKAKKAGIPYSYVLDNVFGKNAPAVAAPQVTADGEVVGKVNAVPDKDPVDVKKIGLIVGICLGAILVIGGGIFATTLVLKSVAQNQAKTVVETFMNAAVDYDVDAMEDCMSDLCKSKKNGFLELYEHDKVVDMFMDELGISNAKISDETMKSLDDTAVLIGENLVKGYEITDIMANDDGSFTIKVKAQCMDLNSIGDAAGDRFQDVLDKYSTDYVDEIYDIVMNSSTEAEAEGKLIDLMLPDLMTALSEAVEEAEVDDATITFKVDNVSGGYKITKIEI